MKIINTFPCWGRSVVVSIDFNNNNFSLTFHILHRYTISSKDIVLALQIYSSLLRAIGGSACHKFTTRFVHQWWPKLNKSNNCTSILLIIKAFNESNIRLIAVFTSESKNTYKRASVRPDRNRGTIDSCRSSTVVALPISGSKVTNRIDPVASAKAKTASQLLGARHEALVCGRSAKCKQNVASFVCYKWVKKYIKMFANQFLIYNINWIQWNVYIIFLFDSIVCHLSGWNNMVEIKYSRQKRITTKISDLQTIIMPQNWWSVLPYTNEFYIWGL